MTKTQIEKKNFVEGFAKRTGIQPNRWGHFNFTLDEKKYRVKIQKQVWRFEVNVVSWIKLKGGKFDYNTMVDLAFFVNERRQKQQ